jgi:hypothetical protein
MAHQMENRDFYNIRRAYNTACGEYQSEIDKRWIVDIDDLDTDNLQNIINNIKIYIVIIYLIKIIKY